MKKKNKVPKTPAVTRFLIRGVQIALFALGAMLLILIFPLIDHRVNFVDAAAKLFIADGACPPSSMNLIANTTENRILIGAAIFFSLGIPWIKLLFLHELLEMYAAGNFFLEKNIRLFFAIAWTTIVGSVIQMLYIQFLHYRLRPETFGKNISESLIWGHLTDLSYGAIFLALAYVMQAGAKLKKTDDLTV